MLKISNKNGTSDSRRSKKMQQTKKGKAEDDSFTAEISRVVEDEEIDEIGTGSGTETERAQVSYDARMKLVPADSDEEEYETSHISDTPVSLSSANDRESLTKKGKILQKLSKIVAESVKEQLTYWIDASTKYPAYKVFVLRKLVKIYPSGKKRLMNHQSWYLTN